MIASDPVCCAMIAHSPKTVEQDRPPNSHPIEDDPDSMKRRPLPHAKHLKRKAFRCFLSAKRWVGDRRLSVSEHLDAQSDWQKAAPLVAVLFIGVLLAGVTWALVETRDAEPKADMVEVVDAIEPPPVKIAVTVEPETDTSTPILPLASDATGIGADLGKSVSLVELADRYEILRRRMPESFKPLDPLIRFSSEPDDLDATLIAGPFADAEAVGDFCRIIRLQLSGHCETTTYQGDALPAPISR